MMAAPLYGETLQQLADSMQLSPPAKGDTQLKLPTIPGAEVTLLGCDYEQIIHPDGSIADLISDTPVRVSFKVKRGDEEVVSRDYEITVPAERPSAKGNAKPKLIPDLLHWYGGEGTYALGDCIVAEGSEAVARELAADIASLFGKEKQMALGGSGKDPIVLKKYSTFAGKAVPKEYEEGYDLDIRPDGVTISAHTDKGLYWGTRSLLQMLVQGEGTAPCGRAMDVPRYAVRGFMLDVGRLPMPLADLKAIIRTMAWYKMNDLQLHLNDNYIFHEKYVDAGEDPFKRSYSAFRMQSDVKGADGTPLTAQDLSYSKAEFRELVDFAKAHGVSIVPEFDTPGHALSFTRVRPDLIYQGPMNKPKRRCEMLDAANPETLRFAGSVWDEYLLKDGAREGAAFAGCPVVHVGSDEFFGAKEDYRAYADGILRHVLSRGYTPRIWGSLHAKKGNTPVVAEGVQMNLWSGDWAKAWDSIRQGYDVINTDDSKLYIVPFANYYRMDKNHRWLYNQWKPNHIHGQLIPASHPQLLGAMFAIWQDECDQLHNGYMLYDYWDALSGSLDVLGERMWGQATPPRGFYPHRDLVKAIGPAPQLDARYSGSEGRAGFHYSPGASGLPEKPGVHRLNHGSLEPGYHLTMELTLQETPEGEEQVLLDSPQGQLLAVGKDGCIGFRRADTMEFSFAGAKLPVGKRVKLELIGKPGSTQLLLDGQPAGTLTLVHNGRTEGLVSTFILPLDTLGRSFRGYVHSLDATSGEASKSDEH